ncbi:hypothetical protein DSCO28_49690 [Desulfosarcina ovata subsp. sediminis]|uniref:ABC transporter substrate-binding protein n=1 Tax=Desulfosarcina ovata subsp. sediminis TaxID=885957 RepID=A0A5K7ZVX1_9BACT|nr:ABC transporter substrate binding protein [Desulfosarcina ovata]BBO84403.1 hypothetical protein DSCO28_49690 [Desulfosarcina ovata subsp. sediminis]
MKSLRINTPTKKMCLIVQKKISAEISVLFFTWLVLWQVLIPTFVIADSVQPRNPDGNGKWRILYYEGGPYIDYTDCMRAIIKGLMEYGWIETADLPVIDGDQEKPYWDWLATEGRSKHLMFSPGDAFSVGWVEEDRDTVKKKVLNRLNSGDIDLVIAMGSWAGQDLATNQHHVPTVVVSTSNPIQANIIDSAEDSGLDHVTARVDSKRYIRQIRMFHRIVGFKRLGVVYENSVDGRLYSAIKELEIVSNERHFEIVRCYFSDTQKNREIAGRDCLKCVEQVADIADAFYLTAMLAIDEQIIPIAEILKKKGLPSFSMNGSKNVEKGILMSVSTDEGYRAQGLYDAKKIIDILNGAKPRDLEQEFPDPLDIAINMDTAREIGFSVPDGVLRVAHKIYGNHGQ